MRISRKRLLSIISEALGDRIDKDKYYKDNSGKRSGVPRNITSFPPIPDSAYESKPLNPLENFETKKIAIPGSGTSLSLARAMGTDSWVWFDEESDTLRDAGDGSEKDVRASMIAANKDRGPRAPEKAAKEEPAARKMKEIKQIVTPPDWDTVDVTKFNGSKVAKFKEGDREKFRMTAGKKIARFFLLEIVQGAKGIELSHPTDHEGIRHARDFSDRADDAVFLLASDNGEVASQNIADLFLDRQWNLIYDPNEWSAKKAPVENTGSDDGGAEMGYGTKELVGGKKAAEENSAPQLPVIDPVTWDVRLGHSHTVALVKILNDFGFTVK